MAQGMTRHQAKLGDFSTETDHLSSYEGNKVGPAAENENEAGADKTRQKFDGETRGRIKHHAEMDDLGTLLFALDLTGPQIRRSLGEHIQTPADIVAWHDENGDFEDIQNIGPKTSEQIEAAVPLIRKVVDEQADSADQKRDGRDDSRDEQASDDGASSEETDKQKEAIERMVEGDIWNPSIIATAFDVSGNVAATIHQHADVPGDILLWHDNLDGELDQMPGIGEQSAADIRRAIPLLKSQGVTTRDGVVGRSGQEDQNSEWDS